MDLVDGKNDHSVFGVVILQEGGEKAAGRRVGWWWRRALAAGGLAVLGLAVVAGIVLQVKGKSFVNKRLQCLLIGKQGSHGPFCELKNMRKKHFCVTKPYFPA